LIVGTYFSTLKKDIVILHKLFSYADDMEIVVTSLVVDDKEQNVHELRAFELP